MFRNTGALRTNFSDPFKTPRIAPPLPAPPRFYEGPGYPTQDRRIVIPHRAYRQPTPPEVIESPPELFEPSEQPLDFLPIDAHREEILAAVKANPVTIIQGATGSGKSTRTPGMFLEAGYESVNLTQPRRAAARNVKNRINDEMIQRHGASIGSELVSFQTGGEFEGSDDAKIRVVTDGLQLVKEFDNGGAGEGEVLIIDELHEWNLNVEFLSAWVKQVVQEKPNLRVVLMSATVDAEEVAEYFADVLPGIPPIIRVEGRTFPIKGYEAPESTVAEEVVKHAQLLNEAGESAQNGILAFVPGKREMQDIIDEIRRRLPKELNGSTVVLPLHAKLSPKEQQQAFEKYDGVKIVVATDVAQTSLTIPDIGVVVDSGLNRRMELDQEGVQGLVVTEVSKADCDQRKGRTGRVAPGTYVLTRLDKNTSFMSYGEREDYPKAEILRTDLGRNTLRLAGAGLDISELELFHPVEQAEIDRAKTSLRMIGALAIDGTITATGKRMNDFPVHASLGRMLVEAGQHGELVQVYMAAIAAAREVGGLQYYSPDTGTNWEVLTEETVSDLLVQLDIFIAAQGMSTEQLREHDLDFHNIERSQELFQKLTRRLKINQNHASLLPPTSDERETLRLCFYAGLIDSVYRHEGGGKYLKVGDPGTVRELSNRTNVVGHPQFVVGYPYRVEVQKKGYDEPFVRHILEQVTSASMCDLGRIATGLTEWRDEGFTMRGGKFVQVSRQYLGNIDMGLTQETPAEPSPRLRAEIIRYAVEHPGKQQHRLHEIKDQLEELARKSKDPIKRLTQDRILQYIEDATPEDITDPSIIENNIRILFEETELSINTFVDPLQQHRIRRNAPEKIAIGKVTLRLDYRNGKVRVKNWRVKDIQRLKEEVFLPDGRHVLFMDRNTPRTLLEMQGTLADAHDIA